MTKDGNDIKVVGERLYAALDTQNWSEIVELLARDLVVQVGSAAPMGLTEWRRSQEMFYRGFPDGRHIIEDALVDHDRFVTRCRFVGTHLGFFGQLAPTGAKVSVGVIHIDRFDNGRLVEHHGQLDMHGLLQQMGAHPR